MFTISAAINERLQEEEKKREKTYFKKDYNQKKKIYLFEI